MKYLKKFAEFINEALKDEIPSHYRDIIKQRHGSKILNKDVPVHTEKIPNVKIEITNPKYTKDIYETLINGVNNNIRSEFRDSKLFQTIIGPNLVDIFHNGELITRFADVKDLKILFSNQINLPDMKEDLPGKEYKISKNKSTLAKFFTYYNKLKGTNYSIDDDKKIKGIMSFLGDYESNLNNIKNDKLYLYISDKSYDKLNASLSKYYTSCQNIYDGEYKERLLANVFDPNTKIAYVISETPFIDMKGNKIDYSPLYRCLIRYDETSGKIMFDKSYPDSSRNPIHKIIEEYTDLRSEKIATYAYKVKEDLPKSYQDTLLSITDIDLSNEDIKKIVKKAHPHSKIKVVDKDEIIIDGHEFRLYNEKDVYVEKFDDICNRFDEEIAADREEFILYINEHIILCRDILKYFKIENEELTDLANTIDSGNPDYGYQEEIEELISKIEDEYGHDLEYDLDSGFAKKYFDFNGYIKFHKEYRDFDILGQYSDALYIEYNGSSYFLEEIY